MRHIYKFALIVVLAAMAGCQTIDDLRSSVASVFERADNRVAFGKNRDEPSRSAQTSRSINADRRPAQPIAQITISGRVTSDAVVDGDTITLEGRKIRLHGIDAPELQQTCEKNGKTTSCGLIAREALAGFLIGTEVQCDRRDVDRYGRYVSVCFANGFDVSAAMVRTGMAVAYRQYSLDYVVAENEARSEKRGMWGGVFTMPWNWRAQKRIQPIRELPIERLR